MSIERLVKIVLVIGVLAWAKPVLLPIALAVYFAFVLTPPSQALERLGLPRVLSVAAIVCLVVAALAVLGATLASQIADLATQTQAYSLRMSQKLERVREGQAGLLGFEKALTRLGRALDPTKVETAAPVRVVPDGQSLLDRLDGSIGPFLQPAALIGIVLVLTMFVLIKRDDLRGRFIRLVGTDNVTITTQTIDDVAARISRFLLTQAYINTGFGAVISAGLYVIEIPYALLWGALAGVLRFVPFVGALVSMLLPSLIAFAIFPGWSETLATLALFLVVDLITAHFLEPVLLGRRTGVSSIALVVSTLFWTWLWGPLGLLLSTPITVCAASVGRHLPRFGFLTVLLGDEPALSVEVNFYQRILAGATGDALRLTKRAAAAAPVNAVFDRIVVPALRLMMRDHDVHVISAADTARAVKDIGDVITRLVPAATAPTNAASNAKILGIAAESTTDALLLRMLAVAIEREGTLDALPVLERGAAVTEAIRRKPDVIYIAAVPPSGIVNARFLCRRLRAQLPSARIVVWVPAAETEHGVSEASARLREAGASRVMHALADVTPAA